MTDNPTPKNKDHYFALKQKFTEIETLFLNLVEENDKLRKQICENEQKEGKIPSLPCLDCSGVGNERIKGIVYTCRTCKGTGRIESS